MSKYRPYAKYQGIGKGLVCRIPEDWRLTRLRNLAVFKNSNVDKKSYEWQDQVFLCNYTDVYYNEFITSNIEFMLATASLPEIKQFALQKWDVIITKDSEDPSDIGIPAIVKGDLVNVLCGYHLTVIRTGCPATSRLIHRTLQSHPSQAHFFMGASGITRYGLGQQAIGNLPVYLPPLQQRASIADFIDRETARIDTLISKKTRFIELLKEKRQAVITKAVTRGLDDSVEMKDSGLEWLPKVPAHWEVRRMASIFREAVRPGDPSLPILSISIHDGITDEELAAEDRDRRVTHIEDRSKYKRVKPNDIAYNMMRAWQGAFGAVAVEGLVSPAYVVAEPIEDLQTGYIEQLLRTPMAVEEMRRYSRGIADFRMRLYWEYFRDLKVCLPPVVEQKAILERIRRATTRIDVLVSKTERSIELLKEHRAALITAAVTGKIDVREAA